ncbi:unnamed protein product [Symbiodinium sp. KB8]|nr:unnamed protein product [Symbiodinium sp. KB8]
MATDLATMLDTVCVSVANSASSVRDAADVKRRAAADAGYEEEEGMHNSCLVVGASAFELRQWAHHGHVSFWLPLCEGRRTHYTQATLATLSRFVRYYGEACDVALATGVSMLMELLFEELPTLGNAFVFIRRRRGGITLYAMVNKDHAQEILERLRASMGPSWWMCSSSTAAAVWDTMVDPARLARSYTWATEKGLCERIVRFPNCQVKQYARPYTTDDERAACKASLVGCDEDPEGLRKIKKLAAQQINESVPSPTSVRPWGHVRFHITSADVHLMRSANLACFVNTLDG